MSASTAITTTKKNKPSAVSGTIGRTDLDSNILISEGTAVEGEDGEVIESASFTEADHCGTDLNGTTSVTAPSSSGGSSSVNESDPLSLSSSNKISANDYYTSSHRKVETVTQPRSLAGTYT